MYSPLEAIICPHFAHGSTFPSSRLIAGPTERLHLCLASPLVNPGEHGRCLVNPWGPDVAEYLGPRTIRTCSPGKRLFSGRAEVKSIEKGCLWSWFISGNTQSNTQAWQIASQCPSEHALSHNQNDNGQHRLCAHPVCICHGGIFPTVSDLPLTMTTGRTR